MDDQQIEKWEKRVRLAGRSSVVVGWVYTIFLILVYLFMSIYVPEERIYYWGLEVTLAICFVLIVLGNRIRKGINRDTKKYLKILAWLSGIWVGLVHTRVLPAGLAGIILVALFIYLLMALRSMNRLLALEGFASNEVAPDYKIKKKGWIVFIVITVIFYMVAAFIDYGFQ